MKVSKFIQELSKCDPESEVIGIDNSIFPSSIRPYRLIFGTIESFIPHDIRDSKATVIVIGENRFDSTELQSYLDRLNQVVEKG